MSKRQPSGRVSRSVSRGNGLPLVSDPIRSVQEAAWDDDDYQSVDATHYALKTVNKHIERRLSKLQANTTRLKRELWLLQRHIKEFRHPLFENWEADMLTRLIEVGHAHQHRKLPCGVVLGQSSFAERENLTHAFSIAAKGIRQNTLQKLGLSEKYHQAQSCIHFGPSFSLSATTAASNRVLPSSESPHSHAVSVYRALRKGVDTLV